MLKLTFPSLFVLLLLHSQQFNTSLSHSYELTSSYDSSNFFDNFNFETFPDPTHGVVEYVDHSTATNLELAKYVNNKVYMGVEHSSILSNQGRKSIRLTSKRILNGNNLIIIDIDHMPTTVGTILPKGCSVWPAFWTFGPDWPNSGEIDIIEYVNQDSVVATSLHTNAGCTQSNVNSNTFTGSWGKSGEVLNTNCGVNAPNQYANTGCGVLGPANTVGSAFNSHTATSITATPVENTTSSTVNHGGVYVLEWDIDEKVIQSYFFSRDTIPQDIVLKQPDPSKWGLPYARFEIKDSNCPSSHFINHNLIFTTTFCGDWAGNEYVFKPSCSTTLSCVDFVQQNPQEFAEAYWLINYLDIYDKSTTHTTTSTTTTNAPILEIPITENKPNTTSHHDLPEMTDFTSACVNGAVSTIFHKLGMS